jgi:hypothetical protein
MPASLGAPVNIQNNKTFYIKTKTSTFVILALMYVKDWNITERNISKIRNFSNIIITDHCCSCKCYVLQMFKDEFMCIGLLSTIDKLTNHYEVVAERQNISKVLFAR